MLSLFAGSTLLHPQPVHSVTPRLAPNIHLLRKKAFREADGLPGQAGQAGNDELVL
jgi:hypothetical protein